MNDNVQLMELNLDEWQQDNGHEKDNQYPEFCCEFGNFQEPSLNPFKLTRFIRSMRFLN